MTDSELLLNEAFQWKMRFLRKSSMFERFSKGVQMKVNERIPEKIHAAVTESIKKMVEATMLGSNMTAFKKDTSSLSVREKDKLAKKTIASYQKMAAAEGIGTGAGGFMLGVADFPLLLSIKMKCLFTLSSIYGFDVKDRDERLYLLLIFQLAFSSDEHRKKVFSALENWETVKEDIDWRVFQQEYRDYIDVVKLFQLLPGIGAAVGGIANYKLLAQLGETARHVFHLRLLKETAGE
ncbi:EcsC family protein [Bacillus atrophaeus]|uniref:Hydrolase n=1 Tax=Bacillus atrophaeus (strain 1942) TaxID=720555 RepID=A0ABM5LUI2_BACA1|nr:EcsC family protein [Bacillus atrophaeus]AMR63545.1 ABC transporter-associated protein EcsC [Bacillus subtilis subsp. globigii]ADP31488.1 putative hydrolase [Bacillus atrophaeus 1942]AIK45491.1 ecsC family protein [Bacillus atrophaeus subsp. globigii]EIM10240.1 putative hydrolase [Bacillus atrophaeus C89]KFK82648.1 ecsC family protein [Bacillus atrophaeus]